MAGYQPSLIFPRLYLAFAEHTSKWGSGSQSGCYFPRNYSRCRMIDAYNVNCLYSAIA